MDDLPRLPASEGPGALAEERRARALLARVAEGVGAAPTVEGALLGALRAVCAHTGWPLGHCWLRDDDGALSSARLWVGADNGRFHDFVAMTEGLRFPAGVGLPGRVLASGRPAWITHVAADANFPRAPVYLAAKLGAAFAFPARGDGGVLAVLEFFADGAQPPDGALMDVLHTTGVLVGHLIEQRRAELRVAHL